MCRIRHFVGRDLLSLPLNDFMDAYSKFISQAAWRSRFLQVPSTKPYSPESNLVPGTPQHVFNHLATLRAN